MKHRKLLIILLDILFLGLLIVCAFAGRNTVPFHGDEASQIAISEDYYKLLYERDIDWVRYDDLDDSDEPYQSLRISIGSINYMTIGMALDLSGITADDLNGFWEWGGTVPAGTTMYDYNVAHGNLPDERLLHVARTPSTVFFALSIVSVFGIAWRLTNSRLATYVSSSIYTTTPAVLVNARRAMQEGAMLFFTALTVFLALGTIEAQRKCGERKRELFRWYAALGVASGFALASKHTSAIIVAAVFLAVLFAPLTHRKDWAGKWMWFNRQHVCRVISAGLISALVFYLLVPIWWSWTRVVLLGGLAGTLLALGWIWDRRLIWLVSGVAALIMVGVTAFEPAVWRELTEPPRVIGMVRTRQMARQAASFGRLQGISERAAFLMEQAFFAQPQYFEMPSWAKYKQIAGQIADYEGIGLSGRSGTAWGGGLIVLFAVGVGTLAARRFDGTTLLISLWLLIPSLVLLGTNILPWQRYYLVLHAPLAVFYGLGMALILWLGVHLWRRPRK